jgi:NADPH:quinone reductase-like Zn-dependent oxidoreductase
VITTVSTSKIPKVPEFLGEGTVDESRGNYINDDIELTANNSIAVIDYTKTDPRSAIEPGSVDFLFDTVGQAMDFLVLMRPKTSRIVSVSTLPSGDQLQNSSMMELPHKPTVPLPFRLALNGLDYVRQLRAWRYGTHYSYFFLQASAEDLDELRKYVEEGKLKTVVGTSVDLRDIEAVRNACQVVYDGKGGLGKLVIKVADT